MPDDEPIATIGDFVRAGKLLEIGCYRCGRHGNFTHAQMPLPEHKTFRQAEATLICSNCGAKNDPDNFGFPVSLRPDARPPKIGQPDFKYEPRQKSKWHISASRRTRGYAVTNRSHA